jgi:hypothetical protein
VFGRHAAALLGAWPHASGPVRPSDDAPAACRGACETPADKEDPSMRSLARSFNPHHAAGYLALFISLGGTAWAAATISSADIQDGQVKAQDIGRMPMVILGLQQQFDFPRDKTVDIPWSRERKDTFDWHNAGSTCVDVKMQGVYLISFDVHVRYASRASQRALAKVMIDKLNNGVRTTLGGEELSTPKTGDTYQMEFDGTLIEILSPGDCVVTSLHFDLEDDVGGGSVTLHGDRAPVFSLIYLSGA